MDAEALEAALADSKRFPRNHREASDRFPNGSLECSDRFPGGSQESAHPIPSRFPVSLPARLAARL